MIKALDLEILGLEKRNEILSKKILLFFPNRQKCFSNRRIQPISGLVRDGDLQFGIYCVVVLQ